MNTDFEDEDPADGHVFAHQDAAIIYRTLMLVIAAIDDLKHVIIDFRELVEIVPGEERA